jgi:hypothetical protein
MRSIKSYTLTSSEVFPFYGKTIGFGYVKEMKGEFAC